MSARDRPTRQRTSREVYDRIRWDPQMDPGAFRVGYDAHSQGMKEVPFLSFVPDGDIPWHRVWYFREGARIVWDRRTRYDEVFAPRERDASAAPTVRWPPPGYFSPLRLHRFEGGAWTAFDATPRQAATSIAPAPLRLLTWNVLDGAHHGEAAETPARFAAIPAVLERADVDVIALQEVTPALWRALLARPSIRRDWVVSAGPEGHEFHPHGVAMLSRAEVAWAGEHRMRGAKRAVALGLHAGVGASVVAAVHLPSNYAAEAAELRARWLRELVEALGEAPALTAVVLGDFNADDRELGPLMRGWVDAWRAAGDVGAGLTFEPSANPLASITSRSRVGQRLDRVYVRAGVERVRPVAAALHVCGPVATEAGALLHLSDHWALRCELRAEGDDRRAWPPRTHRSALAMLLPDGEEARAIDAVRALHDPSYERWPAHANVLYGFVPEAAFGEARAAVRAVCESVDAFEVTLGAPALFGHTGSVTVYLPVTSEPPDALARLEGALVEVFSGCDEQRRAGVYTPHVTLGRFDRARMREALALVDALRTSWRPWRFAMPALTLLARDEDAPFRELGSVEVGRDARAEALSWLDARCAALLYGDGAEAARPVAHAFGGYALGDGTPGDLDAAVIGPSDVPRALFFSSLADELLGDASVRGLRVIDALVPRVAFSRKGVRVDVCYARSVEGAARDPEAWRREDLDALDVSERRVVEGVREAATLRRLARSTVGLTAFVEALTTVKRWARARGIYGSGWAWLGGGAWTLALAATCAGLTAEVPATALVRAFFARMAAWPWPTCVTLTTARYDADPSREPMPVLTTSDPPRNAARGVTRSTARVIAAELARAYELTRDDDALPERLFARWQSEGEEGLVVTLRAPDEAALRSCAGWLESRAVGFALALDAAGCVGVRPGAELARRGDALCWTVSCQGDARDATSALETAWTQWDGRPPDATLAVAPQGAGQAEPK